MQFPVSSGQHHRLNENEWVPVVPAQPTKKDKEPQQQPLAIMPAPCAMPGVSQSIVPQPVQPVQPVRAVQPVQPVEPIAGKFDCTYFYLPSHLLMFNFRICAPNAVDPAPALSVPLPEPVAAQTQPAITNETYLQQQHQQQTYHYPPKVDEPAPSTSIFPDSSGGKELDVTSIITKRLNAMRKLQDNPLDTEALKLMYNTQKDVCIGTISHSIH